MKSDNDDEKYEELYDEPPPHTFQMNLQPPSTVWKNGNFKWPQTSGHGIPR